MPFFSYYINEPCALCEMRRFHSTEVGGAILLAFGAAWNVSRCQRFGKHTASIFSPEKVSAWCKYSRKAPLFWATVYLFPFRVITSETAGAFA
jgi:hypothetical protein